MMPRRTCIAERGVALLAAMLTVTLVATFAAAALWQQWRAVEVETAERARMQASWVLIGAIDWSRLILREDGRGGGADHLAEPWAVPLEEARLTSFLASDKNVSSDALEGLPDAFLSGRIVDAQSKLNVLNLVDGGKPVPAAVAAFTKLFSRLGLPPQELSAMTASLQRAVPIAATITNTTTTTTTTTGAATATSTATTSSQSTNASAPSADAPLLPQQMAQLVWLGLSRSTVTALEPYITILPVRTPININTAGPEVLYASMPKLDMAGAQRLVSLRTRSHFKTLGEATDKVANAQIVDQQQDVSTNYFEILGKLRLDRTWVEERSLVRREGLEVTIIWRERGAGTTNSLPRP